MAKTPLILPIENKNDEEARRIMKMTPEERMELFFELFEAAKIFRRDTQPCTPQKRIAIHPIKKEEWTLNVSSSYGMMCWFSTQ